MEKTAISLAMQDIEESILDELEVINSPALYHPNDVKQANLIVSVTNNITKKLKAKYLELEKNQLIEAYDSANTDLDIEGEQYYTNKFNK